MSPEGGNKRQAKIFPWDQPLRAVRPKIYVAPFENALLILDVRMLTFRERKESHHENMSR